MGKIYSDELRRQAKVFWLSGAYRTDAEIARAVGVTRVKTISVWKMKENWAAERQGLLAESQKKVNAVLSTSLADMQKRHQREYQAMQSKGVQALVKANPRSVGDAVSLLDTGIRGERLVAGEPTEIHEVRGIVQHTVEAVEVIVGQIVQRFISESRLRREDAVVLAQEFSDRLNRLPVTLDVTPTQGQAS